MMIVKLRIGLKLKLVSIAPPGYEDTEHVFNAEFLETPTKTTKLILLDSLLQEVVATLPHLVFQISSRDHGSYKNG
jgi:hypothetical protein